MCDVWTRLCDEVNVPANEPARKHLYLPGKIMIYSEPKLWDELVGPDKEVKEIQAAAQELQDAFNFRSARYSNDYSNFNTGAEETYQPPEESENPQLDVDDWNAKIMANEAAAAPAASQMSAAPPAAPAAPPSSLTKAERLAEVERLYEAKRRALELEFGYEREKLAIELEEEDEEELSAAAAAAADRFEAAAEEAPAAPAENPPTLSSSDLPY